MGFGDRWYESFWAVLSCSGMGKRAQFARGIAVVVLWRVFQSAAEAFGVVGVGAHVLAVSYFAAQVAHLHRASKWTASVE